MVIDDIHVHNLSQLQVSLEFRYIKHVFYYIILKGMSDKTVVCGFTTLRWWETLVKNLEC